MGSGVRNRRHNWMFFHQPQQIVNFVYKTERANTMAMKFVTKGERERMAKGFIGGISLLWLFSSEFEVSRFFFANVTWNAKATKLKICVDLATLYLINLKNQKHLLLVFVKQLNIHCLVAALHNKRNCLWDEFKCHRFMSTMPWCSRFKNIARGLLLKCNLFRRGKTVVWLEIRQCEMKWSNSFVISHF